MAGKTFSESTHSVQVAAEYIRQANEYVKKRGRDPSEFSFISFRRKHMGYYIKDPARAGGYLDFFPEGWAYMARNKDGEYVKGREEIRVCNYPDEDLFVKANGEYKKLEGNKPKFLSNCDYGEDSTHWVSTMAEMCNAPIVTIHEKLTSALWCKDVLGYPSIAMNGCWGWGNQKVMRPDFIKMIKGFLPNTTVLLMLDADVTEKPQVMLSAQRFKGHAKELRKDVEVKVIAPPVGPDVNGWDDWAMRQGDLAGPNWLSFIQEGGIDVFPALSPQFFINNYFVSATEKGAIEHTLDNYFKLLAYHNWDSYVLDSLSGMIYDTADFYAPTKSFEELVSYFQMWMERVVFKGQGSKVRRNYCEDAIRLWLQARRQPIPYLLMAQQQRPTTRQALRAAHDLLYKGLGVSGPMTKPESVKTILRLYRDVVEYMGDDTDVLSEAMLCLIGPPDSGKSSFFTVSLQCFHDWGYRRVLRGQIPKSGSRSKPDELVRIARDCLWAVADEYNPDESSAKDIEQNLLTLSSTRSNVQREMRAERGTDQIIHAHVGLTTTNSNRRFLRGGRESGIERRAIVMEMYGVKMGQNGLMTSDRQVVADCSRVLFVDAYWRMVENRRYGGRATQYSIKYVNEFIRNAVVVDRIADNLANSMALSNALDMLIDLGNKLYRPSTGDVRFTRPHLTAILCKGVDMRQADNSALIQAAIAAGARRIGKSYINRLEGDKGGKSGNRGRLVDDAYAVGGDQGSYPHTWHEFVEVLLSKLS